MLLLHSSTSLKWFRFAPCTCALVAMVAVFGSLCVASAQNRFVQVPKYPAGGPLPILLALEDVDGDGNSDLIVMNANTTTNLETVSFLAGTGNGGFRAPKMMAYFPVSYGVPFLADVNGDGRLDLIFYVFSTHLTRVYRGHDQGFEQYAVVSKAATCTDTSVTCVLGEMQVADVNRDGNPDLLMSFPDSTLYLCLGNGNGSFRTPVKLDTNASSVLAFTTADFNNDGRLDIAIGGYNGIQVLLGNGDGTFRKNSTPGLRSATGRQQFSLGGQLLSADLRGNGKVDLIMLDALASATSPGDCLFGGGISVFLGNGDGTFADPTSYGTGQYAVSAAIGDMNGDGLPDLLVKNELAASYSVLLNAGSGKFSASVTYKAPEAIDGNFLIGNLNGDGMLDVAIAAQNGVEILRNIGGGRLFAPASLALPVASQPSATLASDLNHDGIPDLAIVGHPDGNNPCVGAYPWNYFEVILSQHGQPFSSNTLYYIDGIFPVIPTSIGLGDFNGDGSTDIAVDEFQNGSIPIAEIYFNDGKGQFPTSGAGLNPACMYSGGTWGCNDSNYTKLIVGDFNHDGFADLAFGATDFRAGLGDGKGNFNFSAFPIQGDSSVPYLVRDINGDGKLDVVNLENGADVVDVFLGKGDGTFQDVRKYSTIRGPFLLVSGDFNRDGKIDLAVAGGSEISLLLNRGDGTFEPAVDYPAGGPVSAMAQVSLFGNGNEGVLVADANDDKLFLLTGDGKGHLSEPIHYYSGGGNPQGLTVADFNGDGAPDVLVTDWTSYSYMVLYNTGGSSIKLTASSSAPQSGQVVAFTAIVAASIAGTGTPKGTVAFKDGSTTLGLVNLSGGTATLSTAGLSMGTHTIKASYYGSSTFNPHLSAGLTVSVR